MIAQKTVQEIIETAKIEDVVEEFVNLKRRGVNLIGLCPFHNEKTPSFTVSPAKNICKCFGCGKGGNPVQFLMEHEGFNFPEALRYLAKKYNIEIEETETSQEHIEARQLQDSLYLINQYALDFFQDQLFQTDIGKSVGLSYFKKRGFREETIRKFGLGFAPNAKDKFTLSAVQKGYNIELLRKLALTSKYDSDFFRNRVMFTIHNLSGKVIGFAGRILQKNVKAPKYINSPETEIYHKSKVLYGAYFAKKAIRQQNECILVEGYTDVISLHQAGIENVVASSGTSLTTGQISLIKRYTPNIKILYDGDAAGIKAALRGLDLVLEQDLNVKVVLLPEGEDPDSYLQQLGSTAFKTFIDEKAQDFILFKTQLLLKDASNDPIKKVEVTQNIIQSIARIPDPLKRSVYIKQCAVITEIEESVLVEAVNKKVVALVRKRREEKRREERQKARSGQQQTPRPPHLSVNKGGGYDEASFPSAPPPEEVGAPDATMPPPPTKISVTKIDLQEQDIIRVLINFGHAIYDEENKVTVGEYILGNIEDVLDDFDHKGFEDIAKAYAAELLAGKSVSEHFFVQHENESFRKIAVDLSVTPWDYSPNWEELHGIVLQNQKMPELNYIMDSEDALMRFKLKKVESMMAKNLQKGKAAEKEGDFETMMKHLKMQQKLKQIQMDISKQLGMVIIG